MADEMSSGRQSPLAAARSFFRRHRKTRWILLGTAGCMAVLLVTATLIDWNIARGPVAKLISMRTGRAAAIDGDLKVHLWSWTPTIDIHGLHIANPPWAKRPNMFSAERISITLSLGRLLRGQIVMPRLELFDPEVNLERDARGRASWEFANRTGTPPAKNGKPTQLPTIRMLLIRDGKLDVVDKVKKMTLHGTLTAGEGARAKGNSALQLRLNGSLNAKPLRVDFDGGPLANLDPGTPYQFDAGIVASTIHVTAVVSILRPFDLSEFKARLRFRGNDLADAYYLTGVALPNTAEYDIAGNVHRTDALFRIEELRGKIGSSDINGSLKVDTRKQRFALQANLNSNNLNFTDLAPTLGVETSTAPGASLVARPSRTSAEGAAAGATTLLPDAELQLNRVRGMDADVTYKAKSVTAPKLPMKEVNLHLVLDKGVLTMDPLSFVMHQGTVAGTVKIDARRDTPETSIDMRVEHVDLVQFKGAKATDAPLSGELQGRLQVRGTGSSVHKLASTADGTLGVAIPHGEIRDVLAELTGVNVLRGLGLLFTSSNSKAEIRCGVMAFDARDGRLQANTFFIDTTNVLITGRGDVHLGSERLDLSMQGAPKHLRLVRLRAPVSINGTLSDPAIGIKPERLVVQAGAAVALGALSPVAAALAFVDPGLAKDKNCAAVLAAQNVTADRSP
jgi:uncharacterized protein involved in outer membrane biogenesis